MSKRDAEYTVRHKRKVVSPNQSFLRQLELWELLNYSLEERDLSNICGNEQAAWEEYSKFFNKKRK